MKKHGLMIATAFGIMLITAIISAITAEIGYSAKDLRIIGVWMQVLNGIACGIGLYGGLLLSKEK